MNNQSTEDLCAQMFTVCLSFTLATAQPVPKARFPIHRCLVSQVAKGLPEKVSDLFWDWNGLQAADLW
jgi:hypothetical protein